MFKIYSAENKCFVFIAERIVLYFIIMVTIEKEEKVSSLGYNRTMQGMQLF